MPLRRPGDPSSHPVWRDEQAALIATQRLVRLAEQHGRRVHVLHVSTAEEMAFLADHKDWASVEVTPHHLTLVAPECYERLGTYAQMNPPVRDDRHRQAIWAAVANGVVDVLGSDHAPHTREEKDHAYPDSHSGMTGVQTLVPIMLDHVNAGRLTLERFVDLTSHGPNRLFGIRGKGRIAVGYDADLTDRRSAAPRDHHQRLDPVALRLDALRRCLGAGLAHRHDRARQARDVGWRNRRAGAWPARALCVRAGRASVDACRPVLAGFVPGVHAMSVVPVPVLAAVACMMDGGGLRGAGRRDCDEGDGSR